MKHEMLIVLGVCSSLLTASSVAGDRAEAALGSTPVGAEVPATGKQTVEETSVLTGGAGGAPDTTVRNEEKSEVRPEVRRGRASGAAGKRKRAGTGTAAGYIHDQVKKGNIKIQGATDADIYE